MKPVSDVLDKYRESDEDKYVSREFQKYGYDLAQELGDMAHKSLYIKLAKDTPRNFLEAARIFVTDSQNAKNKGALFMWKLKELKKAAKERKTEGGTEHAKH